MDKVLISRHKEVEMPTSILLGCCATPGAPARDAPSVFLIYHNDIASLELKTGLLACIGKAFPFDKGSFRNLKPKILAKCAPGVRPWFCVCSTEAYHNCTAVNCSVT